MSDGNLHQLPKGAVIKAQKIMRQAFKRLERECEMHKRADLWIVVATASLSAVIAEMASMGKRLREPGGVDAIVKFATGELERMLREDLAGRLAHEEAQVRH